MPVTVYRAQPPDLDRYLRQNPSLTATWLTRFLEDEMVRRRGIRRAVVGLSGGVDSAVTAALCARALGPENTYVFRMPYRISSQASLDDAQIVIDAFDLCARTIDITAMVEGYAALEPGLTAHRLGNICSRCRMIVLFDQSAALGALPVGTGNKTERLLGYYTWHGDDSPPINPLGDLYKTQVWALARELGVPDRLIDKAPTADLIEGQTDEGDLGVTYPEADRILSWLLRGYRPARLEALGMDRAKIDLVARKLASTHWKRRPPTTAMVSDTAIGEYYLRPVDY